MVNSFIPSNVYLARLYARRGKNEERREVYLTYIEQAPEFLTKLGIKSVCGVSGSAGKQANAAGRL